MIKCFFYWHCHLVGKKYINLVQNSNIKLLKKSVLKVSEQKKHNGGGDTIILSLDNQAQPIYPLVEL